MAYAAVGALSLLLALSAHAQGPAWWATRGVVSSNAMPSDYSPVVLGQLKWMATNACKELEISLPGGAGTSVWALVRGFSTLSNNWNSVNVGQLKYVAEPFYVRLNAAQYYTNNYRPWTSTTNDDRDFALANLGQLKHLFAFAPGADTDADELPDWWEERWFGGLTNQAGSQDYDGDGLVNSDEYLCEGSPVDADTDADGMADGPEFEWWGSVTGGVATADDDADGIPNAWEVQYGFAPLVKASWDCVGWWQFEEEEGTNVADSSGYGNDGTGHGMDPWPSVAGYPAGRALNFESASYITVAEQPSLLPTNVFSLAMWLRPHGGGSGGVLSKGSAYYVEVWDGDCYFYLNNWAFWRAFPIAGGEWIHFAVTYDGTNVAIYTNGVQYSCDAHSSPLTPDTSDLFIGDLIEPGCSPFDGDIGDLRIFRSGLPAEVVTNLCESAMDPDGDGATTMEEYLYGTDPMNPASHPVTLSGTISTNTSQTGTIWVVAVTTSNSWATNCSTSIEEAGAYSIGHLPPLTNYWLKAWQDSDGDGVRDPWEAKGLFAENPLYPMSDVANIDITLTDPDDDIDSMPDWWEMAHFGDLDETDEGDFDTDALDNLAEWQQGTSPTNADTDADGHSDGLEVSVGTDPLDVVSHPADLAGMVSCPNIQTGLIWVVAVPSPDSLATNHGTWLPAGGSFAVTDLPNQTNYWIRAWRDVNGNGSNDWWEASQQYAGNPIALTNDVTSLRLALRPPPTDDDADGLPDWWELCTLGSTNSAGTGDPDNDGAANAQEWETGTDPLDDGSFPVSLNGTVSGAESAGPVLVIAQATRANGWSALWTVRLAAPGAYTISNVPSLLDYTVTACATASVHRGILWGSYSNNPLCPTGSTTDIDIELTDFDDDGDGLPDGWEALHGFGTDMATNGLAGWWRMDETNGPTVYDDSGSGNHGTATNMAPWPRVAGFPAGYALDMAAMDDYVTVPHSASLSSTGQVTVAAWVFIHSMTSSVTVTPTIMAKSATIGTAFAYGLYVEGGSVCFNVNCPESSTRAVATGVWTHVAGVYDGSNVVVYVDGRQGTPIPYSGGIVTNSHNLHIGTFKPLADDNFDGAIADVRLYSTGLSAASISNMAAAVLDPDGDGLNNLKEFQYGLCPTNADTDGDGFGDLEELDSGCDPADADSFLASIAGTLDDNSRFTNGPLVVLAAVDADAWASTWSVSPTELGAYELTRVPTMHAYWVRAYRDLDEDGAWDFGEPRGEAESSPLWFEWSRDGLSISLEDIDSDEDALPDWWEVQWFGTNTESGWTDFDEDGTPNLFEYEEGTDPMNRMWVVITGETTAELYWPQPGVTGIVAYGYNLYTNAGETNILVGGMNSFGSGSSTNLSLAGLTSNAEYRLVLFANGAAWTNAVEWIQDSEGGGGAFPPSILCCIRNRAWNPTNWPYLLHASFGVPRREDWDRYYLSSHPYQAGGWTAIGLSLQVGTNLYSFPTSDSLDITPALTPGQTSVTIRVFANDTTNRIGLDRSIYLVKWEPVLQLEWSGSPSGKPRIPVDGTLTLHAEITNSPPHVALASAVAVLTTTNGICFESLANPSTVTLTNGVQRDLLLRGNEASPTVAGSHVLAATTHGVALGGADATVFDVVASAGMYYSLCGSSAAAAGMSWVVSADLKPDNLWGAMLVTIGGEQVYDSSLVANAWSNDEAGVACGVVYVAWTVDGVTVEDTAWPAGTRSHAYMSPTSAVLKSGTSLTVGIQAPVPATGTFTVAWNDARLQLNASGTPVVWSNAGNTLVVSTNGTINPGDSITVSLEHSICTCRTDVVLFRPVVSPGPTNAITWVGGSNVTLTAGTTSPNGLSWSLEPSLQSGATISGGGTSAVVTPGSIGTSYVVRAACADDTSISATGRLDVYRLQLVPAETNVVWTQATNAVLVLTNSYWGPGSVTWTSTPAGLSWTLGTATSSVAITASNSVPGQYEVRCWVTGITNCSSVATVRVLKVDIVQTNLDGHVYCTNCVPFNLTPDSWTNVTWSISPYLGTNGAQFSATSNWTGSGFATTNGTNVWVYSGPVSNLYTLTAYAVELTNAADTATFDVLKPKFLDLNWLETTNETSHNTSLYQTNALVLRRADKFKVQAKLSKGYTNTCFDVWFQNWHTFDGAPKTNAVPLVPTDLGATDWYCKLLSVSNNADQTKTVQMEINLPSTNCAIGEYQWRALVTPKVSTNIVLDTTNFPGQVIILFNPWKVNDSTYMANDADRQEYVMRTTGRIWKRSGFTDNKPVQVWRYAQFDATSLAVILSELTGQNSGKRSDPLVVSRYFSARANSNGGGILEGRWDGNYAGGTNPSSWSGSDQILTQYRNTGNTVKYGQCWVFGGLLTSMLRCAGIPARPLTNYDSFHDRDGNKSWDHRFKQDATGVWQLYSDATHPFEGYKPWNFHVWCDGWMTRPDRPGCDGWQAVDATPQETSGGEFQCGPAPLSAVKTDTGGDYDVNFVYAEVAAQKKTWRWIGGAWVVQQTVPDLVGHDIRTKAVGADNCQVITADYK